MFDLEKDGRGVGCHIKFAILKSITEQSIVSGGPHMGDAADVGSVGQFEPDYVRGKTGEVGAQQSDSFTRLNLHSVKPRI